MRDEQKIAEGQILSMVREIKTILRTVCTEDELKGAILSIAITPEDDYIKLCLGYFEDDRAPVFEYFEFDEERQV